MNIQELLATLEEEKECIRNREDRILANPDDDHASRYDTMGMYSKSIAQRYLLLNQRSEAQYWFERSITFYLSSAPLDKMNQPATHHVAITITESILLTGNSEIIIGLSKSLKEVKLRDDLLFFQYYIRTQACLAGKDFEGAKLNLIALEKYAHYWKKHHYYNGLVDVYSGILEKDKVKLLEGIIKILDIYKRRIQRTKEPPVCLVATSVLILANDNGLTIDINIDIPEKLRMYIPQILFAKHQSS